MASSSSCANNKSYQYDVFLSFSGEDTRKTFVAHLYAALDRQGIRTFRDDERLERGKEINDCLLQAIEDSRFYIIVFSKHYASSSWCLNELMKIMECIKTKGHTAYPVFYDVDPSDVRKQTGSVGEALSTHKNESEVGKWRDALKKAADLSGLDVRNTANGDEAKVIEKIVEWVSLELRPFDIHADENLIGMEQRMQDLDAHLKIGLKDIRMIGIKGMGGAGKTTLARALFDEISINFEGKSFVENVRENSKSPMGLKMLQEQILRDILKDKNITVSGVLRGENLMRNRLPSKEILLVLDDVDHRDQLEMLAGDPTWFKPGSRIIITTRDEEVLKEHKVKWIHDVNLLSEEEAIRLFSRHAFGKDVPTQGYEKNSSEVVRYAAGLPLTIKVLGSKLCGKDDKQWTDTLERLKTIPLKETLRKLELSYESLEDEHKEIFLNVACFFRRCETDEAIRILEYCGYYARHGLTVLEQKSLISLKNKFFIQMHDHMEEMGKDIVRREYPKDPDRHSRLWDQEEIENVLANDLGNEATRFIKLEITPDMVLEGLGNMKKLRCLIVSHTDENFVIDEALQYFPNSLQYIQWIRYSHRCLPKTFEANNLVALEMPNSKIKHLWEGGKATLAIGTATLKSLVQCNVGDKRPVLLCALLPNKTESLQLDLEFDEAEDVMFSVIGPRGVYLTGYYVGHNRHSHMQDDSESFGEDIANSESHESNRGSDEDEYEDSFINDDEPKPLTPSPVSSDRDVEDDDEGDLVKNRNGNGRCKRLKKRYQSIESDDEMSVPVSDNEDDCLISSICKNKKSESLGEKNSNETLAKVEKKTKNNDDKCKSNAGDSEVLDSKDKVDVFADKKTEGKGDKLNSSMPTKDEVMPERKSKRNKKKLESPKQEKATDSLADKDDQKPNDMDEVLTSAEKNSKPKKKRKGRSEVNVDGTDGNLLAGSKQDDDQHAVNKSSGVDSDQLAIGNQSDEKKLKKKRRKASKTQEIDVEKEDNKQAKTEPESCNKKTLSNGLVIEDLVTGKPKGKVAAAGRKVKVQYVVKLKDNGQVVSSNGDTPHKFRLGDKEVIEGLNVGLEGMRVGDKRRLTIPPSMSLGYKGDGENIPPNSWLVYDVEMTSIH